MPVKSVLLRMNAQLSVSKAFQLGRLVTFAGLSQALVQGVGFLGGILIIRLLPTAEYALYVLANTMVGAMTVLADGGISQGVTAAGGKVWKDREKLGAVLSTGLHLRRTFGIASLFIALPLMLYLLRSHNASWGGSLLIVLAVIPAYFSALSGTLLQIAPKLHQDIFTLQKCQVIANCMRFVVVAISLLFLPFASIAVAASGLPQIWANLKLRKISLPYANWRQHPDLQVRKEILKFVRRILPGSIYFCLSGQISIWLISLFGSTTAIAQVGALSRLAILLSLFNVLINLLIIPRFTRLQEDRRLLLQWFVRIQLYLVAFCFFVIAVAWAFPQEVLWVLGSRYRGLESELVLCLIGSCLNLVVGINYTLNTSRGWLLSPAIVIGAGISGIIVGIVWLDISTLRGVLLFNVFTGVVGLFIHPLFSIMKIIKCKSLSSIGVVHE